MCGHREGLTVRVGFEQARVDIGLAHLDRPKTLPAQALSMLAHFARRG
jgi:hypothetical protein